VSAAAAVGWELRFLGRHQGHQRCCQVDAGCCVGPPDETGSQGTSTDVEVAVVGNSGSGFGECRRGASIAETRSGTGTVGRHRGRYRRCRRGSGWRVSGSAVGRRRGRCRRHREGTSAGRSSRSPNRVDGGIRPTGSRVRRNSNVREGARRETHRSDYSGVRPPPWCVEFGCHRSVFVFLCH